MTGADGPVARDSPIATGVFAWNFYLYYVTKVKKSKCCHFSLNRN